MFKKSAATEFRPVVIFSAAFIVAGLIGIASAHAANDASLLNAPAISQVAGAHRLSGLTVPVITVADNSGDNDKSDSKPGMKEKKANRTNQTTGAAGANPGPMSKQKGNQPQSAVKTN